MKIKFINWMRLIIHQFAEPKNPYFDERNLHNLEATIKYQFDENLYSSIG